MKELIKVKGSNNYVRIATHGHHRIHNLVSDGNLLTEKILSPNTVNKIMCGTKKNLILTMVAVRDNSWFSDFKTFFSIPIKYNVWISENSPRFIKSTKFGKSQI